MNLSYNLEVSLDDIQHDPFFSTQSPHPWVVSAGDEISSDVVFDYRRHTGSKLREDQRLVVTAVLHYLFKTDGTLPGRNCRIAVSVQPREGS